MTDQPLRKAARLLRPLLNQGEDYIWRPASTALAAIEDALMELERLHALVARAIPALEQRWRSLPGGVAKSKALADLNAAREAARNASPQPVCQGNGTTP